ncbi:MAG: CRTAC1 family protein [Candidatus Latescibacteria bacterium]|nr:CRTAC1 family protein [Candidatus Latescibacterota bacterium]
MGGGGAFIDYDGDGDLDVFAINGAWIEGPPPGTTPPVDALFRNEGNAGFAEVGKWAGVAHPGFGMGCAVGDYDNDGDEDLYLSSYGPNALFRNEGKGRFAEVGARAGVDDPRWSTSCAFGDYDRDGDLDLFVANYVEYRPDLQREDAIPYMISSKSSASPGVKGYPHPANFPGAANLLYCNEGAGRFADCTRQAGLYNGQGKGLGVVFLDYDDDGWPDLYVAEDGVRNSLYHNRGNGTYEERAAEAGVAYGQDGQMEAGMGVDAGDYDNDGRQDLTVTNFQAEPNALYHNQEKGYFANETYASGVGLVSLPFLGFGTQFLDCDNDGWQDLFVANGHVLDNVELFDQSTTYPQRRLLFHNEGFNQYGKIAFAEVGMQAGPGMQVAQVGRGSAAGDYDNDGDLDLLIINLGQPLALLRNEGTGDRHWLSLRTVGAQSNRDGIGARVKVVAGDLVQVQEVRSTRSYLSSSDLRLHFGLGDHQRVDQLEIRWPSGQLQQFTDVDADQFLVAREGEGLSRQ